ncbi:hypothetical protein SAMN05421505_101299 [Sinosporangium album]|uniref:DUF234 domain-containing protein n=1 Tax=Sinosporangium album TaxID=504805 RepID=A0A1G7R878_9ACTN|nr:hypothetical protein [Sinosporangium album]SDG06978.1 hypothetical protein SAMN05421505_101299 [Sinosporangium album]
MWRGAKARFLSQVVGPHFEQLCRDWALQYGEVLGGPVGEVSAGVVPDQVNRTQIEVDVAVFSPEWPGERRRLLSLGEAKWGEVMGLRHVERLRRARELLARGKVDAEGATLVCYGGAGFDEELRELAAGDDSVRLVDPAGALWGGRGQESRRRLRAARATSGSAVVQ